MEQNEEEEEEEEEERQPPTSTPALTFRPLPENHNRPSIMDCKKETEFSNHALYDRLCTEKLNHY